MSQEIIPMFGPSLTDPSRIVNRDVPEKDVGAYEKAGYKRGRIDLPPEELAPEPPTRKRKK